MKVLRKMAGYEGYGRYWALVETLYDSDGVYLIDKPVFKQVLADELETDLDGLDLFLKSCAECGLIDSGLLEIGHVVSKTVCDQLEYDRQKSEAGKKGMESRWKGKAKA